MEDLLNYTQSVLNSSLPTPDLMHGSNINQDYVYTPITYSNLRKFAKALLTGNPVVLLGEIGCGKSKMISFLAEMANQDKDLIEIHLDDQTDSKSLVGTYVCTDVPGEFKWQPGLITQAVLKGYWLVLDGVEKASLDVIASISTLLDRNVLCIPGSSKEIVAHANFRIIGTISFSKNSDTNISTGLEYAQATSLRSFSSLWHILYVHPMTKHDINIILESKFSSINSKVKSCLLKTYDLLCSSGSIQSDSNRLTNSVKPFTLRDLIKVCSRIQQNIAFNAISGYATESELVACVCEVVEVYLSSVRDVSFQIQLCTAVCHLFQLTSAHMEEIMILKRPLLNTSITITTIGRISLPRMSAHDGDMGHGTDMNPVVPSGNIAPVQYAHTRHSLRLMEKIAACVRANEPVLLVGETGWWVMN